MSILTEGGGDAGTIIGEGAGAPPAQEAPPAQQAPPTEGGVEVPPVEPSVPDWVKAFEGHDQLGEDVLLNPSLKAINSPTDLLKSYVNAQKMIGAEKTVMPTKNSTPEEWSQFYHKLGMPTEFNGYSLDKGEDGVVNEEFFESFKKTAYENNLLPNQAKALLDMVNTQTRQEFERMQAQKKEQLEQAINGLKEEWGDGFDKNVQAARIGVKEFGGDELKAYLEESGLGNDPQIIKAFAKVGEQFLSEDTFEGESKSVYAMTPDEAQGAANRIMGDLEGPYYNSAHPDHKRTVEEVNKLFSMM